MTRRIVETRRRRLALLPRDDNLLTLLLTLLNLKLTFASVSSNYCTRRAVIIQRYNRTFDLPRVPRRRRSKRVSSVGFASEAQRFGSDSGPSIHPSVRQHARTDGFSRRCFRPTRFPGPLRIPRSGFAATCGSARPPRASSRPAFSFLHSFDRPQRSLGPDKMPSAASSFILHADAVGGAVGAPPDLANALTARWFADRRTRPARGFEQVAVSLVVKRRRRRLVRGRGRGRARRRRRARAAVRASPADAIAEVVEHPEQRVSRVAHVSRAARRAAPRRPSTHASRRALEEVERRPARRERGRALHAARARVPELVQLQGVPCALFGGAGAAVFVRRVGNISARRPRSRGHAEEFEARRAAMRARDDRSLRARGAVDRRARQSMRFSHRSRSISRSSDRRDATRGANRARRSEGIV